MYHPRKLTFLEELPCDAKLHVSRTYPLSGLLILGVGASAFSNLFFSFSVPEARADISTGLVGHWTFDEGSGVTAADSSGNGNDGTLTNGPTWTSGKVGSGALDFDKVDDLVNAGSASSLDDIQLQGGGGLTASAWIYPRSAGEFNAGTVVAKSFNNLSGAWVFRIGSSNRLLEFIKSGSTNIRVKSAAGAFALNQWQHVLVTWDGSTTAANVHIYVNGQELTYDTQQDGVSLASDAA